MSKSVEFLPLLRALAHADARVIVIGAVSMVLHGADYATFDVDVCYERSPDNVSRICDALSPHSAFIRSAPREVASALLENAVSLNIATDFGDVDFIAEVSGLGDYTALLPLSQPARLNGLTIPILSIDGLIRAKEAMNRVKDQQHLAMLRALKAMENPPPDTASPAK